MQSPPFPRYIVLPRSKYSSQHYSRRKYRQYLVAVYVAIQFYTAEFPGQLSRYSDSLLAERSGDRIRKGRGIQYLSGPALRPSLPPIYWVTGLSRE